MHPWAFRARFRRTAFGWKGSKLAIERIHEALAEIRAVARQDPATAAEGAVLFLEKLSPALNQIDSSSGALGNATYAAVRELVPDKLLGHLIASTPGEPGKWFATAKTLKLFDRATQLAWASPCDPKTLTRAARDHVVKQPGFAMQAALAALHWMSMGHSYELTGLDAHEAHRLAIEAARTAQQIDQAQAIIDQVLAADRPMSAWMRRSLGIAPTSPPTLLPSRQH
jgi:hypothetical protein